MDLRLICCKIPMSKATTEYKMEDHRNKGGRPRGSGKDDSRDLNKVAEIMAKDRTLKKTPAISRIVQERYPPHHWQKMERRLLRKWNDSGEERLLEARQKLEEKRRREREDREEKAQQRAMGALAAAAHAAEAASIRVGSALGAYDTSSLTAAQAAQVAQLTGVGSAASEMQRQMGSALKAAQLLDPESTIGQALLALNKPAIRSVMDQLESPTMRAMREFQKEQDRIRDMIDPMRRFF